MQRQQQEEQQRQQQKPKQSKTGLSSQTKVKEPNTDEMRKDPPYSLEDHMHVFQVVKTDMAASSQSQSESSVHTVIIRFLLSNYCLQLCQNPESEPVSWSLTPERDYYTKSLTPAEHLLCAVVMSRATDHITAQSRIKRVLNNQWAILNEWQAYKLRNPSQVEESVIADVGISWDCTNDGSFSGLLDLVRGSRSNMKENIRTQLKEKIEWLEGIGVDIFLRRVQGCEGWEGIGWFVDEIARKALEELGLPGDGKMLKRLIEESGEPRKRDVIRKNFVAVMERALGVLLERKMDVLRAAVENGKWEELCA